MKIDKDPQFEKLFFIDNIRMQGGRYMGCLQKKPSNCPSPGNLF